MHSSFFWATPTSMLEEHFLLLKLNQSFANTDCVKKIFSLGKQLSRCMEAPPPPVMLRPFTTGLLASFPTGLCRWENQCPTI